MSILSIPKGLAVVTAIIPLLSSPYAHVIAQTLVRNIPALVRVVDANLVAPTT
jgi:hypothetical protein